MNSSKPPAVLSVDIIFTWYSEIANTDCQCRLRIYKITFDTAVVIVSELPDNSSCPITAEASTLVHLVCNNFALNPTKTMWLQYYSKRYFKDEEIYEQVILIQNNVCSKKIKKEQIEVILGVELKL